MGKFTIKIRLNRDATNNRERWRLDVNGECHLVAGATIHGIPVFTSMMVIETGELKYCIECEANEVIFQPDGLAVIK